MFKKISQSKQVDNKKINEIIDYELLEKKLNIKYGTNNSLDNIYKHGNREMCLIGNDINKSLCGRNVTNELTFMSELGIQQKPKEINVCINCIEQLKVLKKIVNDNKF